VLASMPAAAYNALVLTRRWSMCRYSLSLCIACAGVFFLAACAGNSIEVVDGLSGDGKTGGSDTGPGLDAAESGAPDSSPEGRAIADEIDQVELKPDLLPELPPPPDAEDVEPDEPQLKDQKENVEPCDPPVMPDNCIDVPEFQCGFMAECVADVIHVEWHVHYFCGEAPEGESIIDFECNYGCPNGCQEGEYIDWPPNGQELVEQFCDQCNGPSDCEGLPHDDCVGAWGCSAGKCGWACGTDDCVEEGGSVPVVPDAPECCPGLELIPCGGPNPDGTCNPMCVGASICAYCGNNVCGKGENVCNCPVDCASAPPKTECEKKGGVCVPWDPEYTMCPEGTQPTGWGCENKSQVCCHDSSAPGECNGNFFSCGAPSDCAKIDGTCCPCSMGGSSIAVNSTCIQDWIDAMNCPPDIACIALYNCDESVPTCVNGLCKLLTQP